MAIAEAVWVWGLMAIRRVPGRFTDACSQHYAVGSGSGLGLWPWRGLRRVISVCHAFVTGGGLG
jgi:putative component of membrane protein insertase Oxa1/YidC/SpoIIIJ protein YidD